MGTEEIVQRITLPAGADLSAAQYLCVSQASDDGQVDLVSGTTGLDVLGILQNKPDAAGKAADVAVGGVARAIAGAAINPGALVMNDTAGKVITATGSGKYVIGRHIGQVAASAGDVVPVLLAHPHILA